MLSPPAHRATGPLLVALLGCTALGGCAPFDLPLSWVFIDGRDCADAGVELIALRVGDDKDGPVARCTGGQGGRHVTLPEARRGQPLAAAAQSPGGGVLYRGLGRIPEPGSALELVLYYTGGQ